MLSQLFDIEYSDPLFWLEINKILTILKNNNYTYIDDHNQNIERLEYLLICQTGSIIDNKFVPVISNSDYYYTSFYPIAWLTPFYQYGQCKNRLYVKNNQVHLTTIAIGQNINIDEASLLYNSILRQFIINDEVELNFVININSLNKAKLI